MYVYVSVLERVCNRICLFRFNTRTWHTHIRTDPDTTFIAYLRHILHKFRPDFVGGCGVAGGRS